MNRWLGIVCGVGIGLSCLAAEDNGKPPASIQFNRAHQLLTQADAARDKANYKEAVGLYRDAAAAYQRLSSNYPDWQPGVTQFRITYVNSQIESIQRKIGTVPAAAPPRKEPPVSPKAPPAIPKEPSRPPPPRAAAVTPAAKSDVQSLQLSARVLLDKGEIEKARAALLDALKRDPDDKKTRVLLGLVHCRAGEFENAVYLLEGVLQDDSSSVAGRMALGVAYFGVGKIDQAKEEIRRVLLLNPKLPEANFTMAQILAAGNPADIPTAQNFYKTALELGAKPDTNLNAVLFK